MSLHFDKKEVIELLNAKTEKEDLLKKISGIDYNSVGLEKAYTTFLNNQKFKFVKLLIEINKQKETERASTSKDFSKFKMVQNKINKRRSSVNILSENKGANVKRRRLSN